MGLAPVHHIVVIVVRRDRGAYDQEQHLGRGNPPAMDDGGPSPPRNRPTGYAAGLLAECLHLPGLRSIRAPTNHNHRCLVNRR